MIDRRLLALFAAVALGMGVWAVTRPAPVTPAPPATTTSTPSTTSTSTTSVVSDGGCAALQTAATGTTVTLAGAVGTCTIWQPAESVTVTGRADGRIACYRCTRWKLDDLRLAGSVHMVGGVGWQITGSTIDGQDAGLYGVVAVGQTPESGPPVGWVIRDSLIERPGNSPDHSDVQDHALYIIAFDGVNLDGLVEDVTVRGSGAGAAVKIGGTGNQGGYGGDAADGVTLRRVTVENTTECVLAATNTDRLTVADSTLDCPLAVSLGGPFTGTGLTLTGNRVRDRWIVAHLYNNPQAGVWAPLFGTRFVTLAPFDCDGLATCAANVTR